MRSSRNARRFLAAGLAVAAAWLALPPGSPVALLTWPIPQAGAAIAIAAALRAGRTPARPWRLLLAGGVLCAAASVLWAPVPQMLGRQAAWVGELGLLAYVPAYALITAGLLARVRRDDPALDRAAMLDLAIISLGLGLALWTLVMSPAMRDASSSLAERALALAFPAFDLAIVAAAVRIAVAGRLRGCSDRLLVGFASALLVSDLLWSLETLAGSFTFASPVLGGYAIAWVLLGAAALYPQEPDRRVDGGRQRDPARLRQVALALAVLVPLALIVVRELQEGADVDVLVLVGGAAVLFLLVLARLRDLHVSVDEQRRLAEQLAQAEARHRGLIERIPAVTYIDVFDDRADHEPLMMYIGPQVEELFGYTREEWLGHGSDPWLELVHPEDRDRVLAEGARAAEERAPVFRSEYRMRRKDGSVLWVREEASIEYEPASGAQVWRGVIYDVTERRAAEEALREAEGRYRLLVERLPVAAYSWVLEGDRVSVFMSPQVERLLGVPAEAFADAEAWMALVHPDDLPAFRELDTRSTATGEPFRIEYRMRHADGRWVWMRDEAELIEGAPGADRQVWHGILADVTERRQAQEELEERLRELRRLHDERSALAAALAEAQEFERAAIAESIHDDPVQHMTAVGLHLAALRRFVGDPEGLARLEQLEATVNEAIRRLRRLLFELRPRSLDTGGLAAALREYLHELESADDGTRYVLLDDLATEPSPTTRTVAYRIAQEALRNARVHARASRVEIALRWREGGVHVVVADDGVGADPADLRGRPGHLGISSMRERAELNGGWLRIDTGRGGTRVEFWLPDVRAPVGADR